MFRFCDIVCLLSGRTACHSGRLAVRLLVYIVLLLLLSCRQKRTSVI